MSQKAVSQIHGVSAELRREQIRLLTHVCPAAGSLAETKGAVDPIIQQLLKNARSEAVRQEFLSMSQAEYTSKHSIKVLVSRQSSITSTCTDTEQHVGRQSNWHVLALSSNNEARPQHL